MTDPKADYQIVRFAPSHIEDLSKLRALIYGGAVDVYAFRRKYATELVGGAVIGFLAYDTEGELAAYYGVFPIKVRRNGREMIAAQSGDTMTHPKHQGKGLFVRLAKLAYETAKSEGIAFVFGFPNQNSYPGFTKKLGWKHRKTMRRYDFFVPTLPITELAYRAALFRPLSTVMQEIAIRLLSATYAPDRLHTSTIEPNVGGVVRNKDYLHYKGGGLRYLQAYGTTIYFKVSRFLEVGDICAEEGADLKKALRRLKWLAFVMGIVRIRFYISPGAKADRQLSAVATARDALAYGHLSFQDTVDPDDFAFSYIDYDTF